MAMNLSLLHYIDCNSFEIKPYMNIKLIIFVAFLINEFGLRVCPVMVNPQKCESIST